MQYKKNKTLNILTTLLILIPMLGWAGISVNSDHGSLQGLGHAKSHDFPVIAEQFSLTLGDADSNGVRQVKAMIPVAEISTGNFMRNAHMRMAMFSGDYPEIIFSANVTLPELAKGIYPLNGTLTINGIAKPYNLEIKLDQAGRQWHATGKFVIVPTDFDMGLPGMGPMKVQDHVDLNLDVTF